ncbi:Crp/Fnr family transcriptional regulator [Pedobacter sp.]|uniref:Crp/Fnr family transcriptional regulator n=1 Tax=Pedobacter sp. TaxID=1411316 RepID=UPI003BAC6C01
MLPNPTVEKLYANAKLSKIELSNIVDAYERIELKKGNFLLEEGQIANQYYCLERGLIRSFVNNYKGDEITTNFFGTNEIVIEVASLFQRIPTKENIQALTDCVCWKIDFDAFQKFFHSIEGFREWGRSYLSGSLFHFKQRSISMITDSATDRYLDLLKQKPEILKHAALKHIATYLGITDTSLSRIRKEIFK